MSTDGCSISEGSINGWRAIVLANGAVETVVLPEKGADIYSLVDRGTGIDVLFKTPWGLQAPGSPPRKGSDGAPFLYNYEGGWQELFPNTFLPCTYENKALPLHGEVATLPWNVRTERNDDEVVRICLDVQCRELPLRLTRRMSLSARSRTLILEETVLNESDKRVPFVWGHHPVLGGPFIRKGCRIEVGKCTVFTPAEAFEPATASLVPGQRCEWPHVAAINGDNVDLRQVLGPDASVHDHAYLTSFDKGWISVENSDLGLEFIMEWDPGLFRWLVNWRPFGGSRSPPLAGIYAMGVELWSTRSNLRDALCSGDALWVDPRASMQTSIKITLKSSASREPTT
jgi:galactose mutarotase-like enzyme